MAPELLPRDQDPTYVCEVIEEITTVLSDCDRLQTEYGTIGNQLQFGDFEQRIPAADPKILLGELQALKEMRDIDLSFQAGLYKYAVRSLRGGAAKSEGKVSRDVMKSALLMYAERQQENEASSVETVRDKVARACVIARFVMDENTTVYEDYDERLKALRTAAIVVPRVESNPPNKYGFIKIVEGTPDPATGKLWIDLANPRAVEIPQPRESDTVVGEFRVTSESVDTETGAITVTTSETWSDQGVSHTFTFGTESDMYRLVTGENGAKRLQLFIPRDRTYLLDESAGRSLSPLDSVDPFILTETGANLPSVFDSFEDLHGNPIPVSVAKRD